MHPRINRAIDTIKNRFFSRDYDLVYVTEGADWTIKNVGEQLIKAWQKQNLLRGKLSTTAAGLRNKIIHFGSIHTFLTGKKWSKPHSSNLAVVTWFHVLPGDLKLQQIKEAQEDVRFIHTASLATHTQLLEAGVRPEKIKVIPLGVDIDIFQRAKPGEKEELRQKLGIPTESFVIGSFQKDGEGFGEGLKPKYIKGPDILVGSAIELAKRHKVHVLLTGPARGYVKEGLKKAGIPFTHVSYLKKANQISVYYRALDLYLATARIEGGPMQIFESWASGIPYVAVKTGLIPDVAKNGHDLIWVDEPDALGLAKAAETVIEDKKLVESLIDNGLQTVKNYDWKIIARRYVKELYSDII